MIEVVDWGLPPNKGPVTNAVRSGDRLFTVQIPREPTTGEIQVEGDIREQTKRCLDNLKTVMEAAGGSLADVAQITVFLTDSADAAGMNEVYAAAFRAPYPNRATVVVKELMQPGMRIEMVVQACLSPAA